MSISALANRAVHQAALIKCENITKFRNEQKGNRIHVHFRIADDIATKNSFVGRILTDPDLYLKQVLSDHSKDNSLTFQ